MSKSSEKREDSLKQAPKKDSQVESEYSFPEYGITVRAKDQFEALEKVKKLRAKEEGVKE